MRTANVRRRVERYFQDANYAKLKKFCSKYSKDFPSVRLVTSTIITIKTCIYLFIGVEKRKSHFLQTLNYSLMSGPLLFSFSFQILKTAT